MKVYRSTAVSLVLARTILSGGCASIMSGRHADVRLTSNVPDTHVVVRDQRGEEVASVQTPAVVSLKRKGRFIWPARYTATFEAQGYAPLDVPINPTLNPWIAGNIVAGGLVGLAVDNVTGAAWTPKHDELCAQLAPTQGPIMVPQVAAVPPAVAISRQASTQPASPATSEPPAQPASSSEPVVHLPTSPALQPSVQVETGDPRYGGSISVGGSYPF